MTGKLTTHVLDTARGRPAVGMALALYRLDQDGARELLLVARTNDDGRPDGPLLEGEALRPGLYELVFEVGDHFAPPDTPGAMPFLGEVPVRFGVADADAHYHVPLLVTPWSYSTYRGS